MPRVCTRPQIAQEVLAQVRAALPGGAALLPDPLVQSSFVDPAITGEGTAAVANDEPLLINTTASWTNRPTATTRIPNLYLAADHVRNNINLATMEGYLLGLPNQFDLLSPYWSGRL